MTLEEAIAEIEKLTEERAKLVAYNEEYMTALIDFIAMHPSLFNTPYRGVHFKLKQIAEKQK
jgi:predicted methyltransferase